MKKILLLTILTFSLAFAKAQTVEALADSSFAHQDYTKAFDYYSEVIKTEPANLKALRRRGFCMMNFKGQELNATRFFSEALKVDPKDMASHYYLGVIYMDAAKAEANATEKAHFKALAQTQLKEAAQYGSEDAKAAIKNLNGI